MPIKRGYYALFQVNDIKNALRQFRISAKGSIAMKTKSTKLFRVMMLLICVVLALSMVACSEREPDDDG